MPHPWFRLYSETIRDRKIDYAANAAQVPRPLILGVWTTLLCLANDSPIRGTLLLAKDIPLTEAMLCKETGLTSDALGPILKAFEGLGMVSIENFVVSISNWDSRQFESDSSTERTREYRERHNKAVTETTAEKVTTPSPDRHGDLPESETETESETEAESESETDARSHRAKGNGNTFQEMSHEERQLWDKLKASLQLILPKQAFETWVKSCSLHHTPDGWTIHAVNAYALDWLSNRLKKTMQREWEALGGEGQLSYAARAPP